MVDYICGKIAAITGGANGIGAAYVQKFFNNNLKGCAILDVDESGAALAQKMNCQYGFNKALFVKTDVRDQCAFESALQETILKYKRIDLLINNSGIAKEKIWETMIDINVKGTVTGTLLGIKYMGKNNGYNGGTIVNTSSILGLEAMSAIPCYTGSKHFVIGLTRSMGTQYWDDLTGIRFLTICPGVIETAMPEEGGKWVLEEFPETKESFEKDIRAEKWQGVEYLAEAVMTMLNEGKNGSIWVSRRKKPVFEVELPKIHQMSHRGKCHLGSK